MKTRERIIAESIEEVYKKMNFDNYKKLALHFVQNSDNAIVLDICQEIITLIKKEELNWMEGQIVSRHPIDFYNRTVEIKKYLVEDLGVKHG